MRFENPLWLILIILWVVYVVFDLRKNKVAAIRFSNVSLLKKIGRRSTKAMTTLIRYSRYLILLLIIITLARPQSMTVKENIISKGIDIMMVLDTSGSMAAEDFQPDNRLLVAKQTMQQFILKRKTDRIGLVVFGSEAYTLVPLSTDYQLMAGMFDDIELSMAGDGTAIGMAIATGLNRLRDSDAKSKIMILLTDGENNAGEIDPIRAAKLAKDIGVKIYTIGIGKKEGAKIPYMHPVFGKMYHDVVTYLDEESLTKIAETTYGRFYRATDENSLIEVYNTIDKLEKTEIKSTQYIQYYDFFPLLLNIIFVLILLELLLVNVFYVVTP